MAKVCMKSEKQRAPPSLQQTQNFGTDWLIRFKMTADQGRVVSKIDAKFDTFLPGKN